MISGEKAADLLGKTAADSVTGFSGTITAVALYLSSQPRVCIEAMVDGKPAEHWLPADRVQTVLPA